MTERKAELMQDGSGEEAAGLELIRRKEPLTSMVLAELDPAALIGALVTEGELTIRLTKPPEEVLDQLRDETSYSDEADQFVVAGSDDYALADQRQTDLQDQAEALERVRKGSNSGLLAMKSAWDMLFNAKVKDLLSAVQKFQNKMRTYEKDVKAEADKARINADAAMSRGVRELKIDAEQLRTKASKIKDKKKREDMLAEADRLERTAAVTPESMTVPSAAVPKTGGSGRAGLWEGTITDMFLFLCWVLALPKDVVERLDRELVREQIGGVQLGQSVLNDLAKLVTNSRKIPGFSAEQVTSYRRNPRRK